MVAAKKREYESSAALEHNSLKLKQTFLAFLRQMELAGEGADGMLALHPLNDLDTHGEASEADVVWLVVHAV